jgi:hypothetical protein
MNEGEPHYEPAESSREPQSNRDWLEAYVPVFWPAAQFGFEEWGRGALIIQLIPEEAEDETRFHYADQTSIEPAAAEVYRHLGGLVSTYDPQTTFVAVIMTPGRPAAVYQIKIGDTAVEIIDVDPDPDPDKLSLPGLESTAEPVLAPPDLETLMAWADEGGCEAACPHACWTEPDGTCSHGQPSWLLKLGLI